MPRLTGGGATFGAGAGPGAMACIAGRLLCDTYVSSRELLREVIFHVEQYLQPLMLRLQLIEKRDIWKVEKFSNYEVQYMVSAG
jgi:hypothetical protein